MKLAYLFLSVAVALSCAIAEAQSPCPDTFPTECECIQSWGSDNINCSPFPRTNIKTLLAVLEDCIPTENDESFGGLLLNFGKMGDSTRVIIEANSLNKLKFRIIEIISSKDLHIDAAAFPSTSGFTEKIFFSNVIFSRDVPPFPFIRNFSNLKEIRYFGYGEESSELSEIPDRAFYDMTNLEWIAVNDVELETLGSKAFEGIPKLRHIELSSNNLSLEGIPDGTFSEVGTNVKLDLTTNPRMTHLPREKFETFLDKTNNSLILDITSDFGDNYLNCDERAKWICDKASDYKDKIFGFNCKGREGDVFAFCNGASKFVEISSLFIFVLIFLTMLQKIY